MNNQKSSRKTESANRRSVQPVVVPRSDDIHEAYSEAADHLDACADEASKVWDNPDAMRAAYRIVAKKIRNAAKRHNADSSDRR